MKHRPLQLDCPFLLPARSLFDKQGVVQWAEGNEQGRKVRYVGCVSEGGKKRAEQIQEVGWWRSASTYRRSLINSMEN